MALALAGAMGFGSGLGYAMGRTVQERQSSLRPRVAAMSVTTGAAAPSAAEQVNAAPKPAAPPAGRPVARPAAHRVAHRAVRRASRPAAERKHRVKTAKIRHHPVRRARAEHHSACVRLEGLRARLCRTLFKEH
ncbi:hypothetical protein AB0H88_39085 [Nonomuraea sp. NPDC050680]|uniref:hypothetical protein n=1 Tax=Nonomuraea sp. NPDC050680 TaxID=3154630 RepID=UPI0033E91F71